MFWIAFALLAGIGGAGQFALGMAQLYPPFAALLARQAYAKNPDLIATTADLIQQRYKEIIDDADYFRLMAQAGYNEVTAKQMYDAAKSYLTGYDYVSIWRRGLIDDSELDTNLTAIGYDNRQKEYIKKATLYYPSPSDVVSFAVREVYKPDIVAKYGQDQELDPQYLEDAVKSGLSEDFAKKYWEAHWQLPSAMQGYEMLHRGVIDDADLEKLLGTLDYMPFWRSKLKAISYNPLTRVDVRRMYQAGTIGRDKVLETYKSLGYDDTNAQLLTEWTITEYAPKAAKDITGTGLVLGTDNYIYPSESLIVDSYKRKLIPKEAAKLELQRLHYANETIDLLLDRVDQQLKQDQIDFEADAITDKYRSGAIDEIEYRLELTQLGVPSEMLDSVISRELTQAKHRVKMPSKADLDKWYKIGLIDEEDYRGSMRIMGYRDSDIDLYIAEIQYDSLSKEQKDQLAGG